MIRLNPAASTLRSGKFEEKSKRTMALRTSGLGKNTFRETGNNIFGTHANWTATDNIPYCLVRGAAISLSATSYCIIMIRSHYLRWQMQWRQPCQPQKVVFVWLERNFDTCCRVGGIWKKNWSLIKKYDPIPLPGR